MSDRVLEKYVTAKAPPSAKQAAEETDSPEDLGSFGLLRGIRERAISLELRLKGGNIEAFPYAYLSHARFDPSEGIELQFGGKSVRIAGQNLGAEVRPNITLFSGIVRHRIAWIAEADEPTAMSAPRGAVIVDEISVK